MKTITGLSLDGQAGTKKDLVNPCQRIYYDVVIAAHINIVNNYHNISTCPISGIRDLLGRTAMS